MLQSEALSGDSAELEAEKAKQREAIEAKRQELVHAREAMEDMQIDMFVLGGILALMTVGVGIYLFKKRLEKRDQ